MSWRDKAACIGAPPEIIYSTATWKRHPALDYCDRCPVVTECLTDALSMGELGQAYVRGGMTPVQREKMLRERRRASA